MKATVTKAFPGRPDHEVMTREIKVGEIIDGDLAHVAIENNWAEKHVSGKGSDADAGDAHTDLEKLTVAELKALAEQKKIDIGTAIKKAEIIAAIQAASQAA